MSNDYKCPNPSCDGFIPNNETPGAYPGALSRRDNQTEICSTCGNIEALEDWLDFITVNERKNNDAIV